MKSRLTKTHVNNRYLFKASWRGTAHSFWIEAPDSDHARKKADRYVFKMEGGRTCLEIELIRAE